MGGLERDIIQRVRRGRTLMPQLFGSTDRPACTMRLAPRPVRPDSRKINYSSASSACRLVVPLTISLLYDIIFRGANGRGCLHESN